MRILALYEEILLLALREEQGTPESGVWLPQALGGAMLAELLIQGRLEVEGEGRKQVVRAVGEAGSAEDILEARWREVRDAAKPGTLRDWVRRFANNRDLRHQVAAPLVEVGILDFDERKVLLLFTRKVYPEADGGPEARIWKRLEAAVFGEADDVDARTVVLLSLADAANLLKLRFERKELRARKERIAQVVNGEKSGAAAREVIRELQSAVLVAAIMPAMISATVASH